MSADRTPAPVAVPEGGWQDGDEVVRILSQGFQVGARGDGAWRFSTAATATEWTDEDVDWMVETERVAAIYLTPRPEPVVALLPTEAVDAAVEAFGDDVFDRRWRRERIEAALRAAGYRLVPEDDEDTVRVPRPVVPHGPEHLSENAATAHYLREMAKRVDRLAAGSNVTATMRKLISDAADSVEALDGPR